MAGKRGTSVPRPAKVIEYEIIFGSNAAQRGWTDLRATAKNALTDAWDYLTAHPTRYDADRCYRLKGDLGETVIDGTRLPQWQYKISDGARLWYAVAEPDGKAERPGRVYITNSAPGHPNETDSKKNFR
jgi:hypothetical protein